MCSEGIALVRDKSLPDFDKGSKFKMLIRQGPKFFSYKFYDIQKKLRVAQLFP